MPLTDPIQGWQTPAGTELPDGAAAFAGLRDTAVKQVNLRFATTTARDAAITPAGNRKAGMRAWIDALGYWTTVLADGGSWVRESVRDVFVGTEPAAVGTAPAAGTLKVRQEFTFTGSTDTGAVIEWERVALGLSQEDLARAAGISQGQVSRIFAGLRPATVGEFLSLCQGVGLSLSDVARRAGES